MHNNNSQAIYCGNCGQLLDENTEIKYEDRAPCSYCLSLTRNSHNTISEKIEIYEYITVKYKLSSSTHKNKWRYEAQTGHQLHRKTGEYVHKTREIDRDGNKYKEIITDKNGETMRHVEEKLSAHIGHGSAKTAKS